mmetsp:Transcript_64088/g.119142  ORF Transcript_64088/g.119142 Transcript_64088/m.119142 type:complete len:87 (-) Transcript_64088:13-273(-)
MFSWLISRKRAFRLTKEANFQLLTSLQSGSQLTPNSSMERMLKHLSPNLHLSYKTAHAESLRAYAGEKQANDSAGARFAGVEDATP